MAAGNEVDDEPDDDAEDDESDESEPGESDVDEDEDEDYDASQAAGAITTVFRFLKPYYVSYRSSLALLGIGVLIETGYNVAFPLCLKYLIDNALIDEDVDALKWILVVLGVLAVVVSAVSFWYEYQNSRLGAIIVRDIRQSLFEHLQTLSQRFYSRTTIGDVLSRFSTDLGEVEEAALNSVSWGVMPALELVTAVGLLFYLNWRLALAAMLVWPLTLLGPRFFSPRAVAATYQKKQLEADTLSVIQENVSAQPVVKAFGLQLISLNWFRQRNLPLAETTSRVSFLNAMVERSVNTAVLLLHLLILGFGAWLAFHKHISVGTLVTFESVFWELSYNIGHVSQFIPVVIQAAGSIHHINDLLEEPSRATDAPDAEPLPRLEREIVFDDVSFGYTEEQSQLKSLTLRIPRGSNVAIVGPSGSGKSTVLSLLMQFYEPTSGTITIDGHDLRKATRQSLRAQMGIVFQENILFNISLRENIRLGNPAATEKEVEAAARAAEIHRFIKSLPQGYDTIAGERGGLLSGGQRQRIAIARAIIRDPAILILDEATSALDHTTEAAINATIRRLAKGRTVISVTHRLTSVAGSDRIFVLEQGELVEEGSHRELLGRNGLYYQLWQQQMSNEPKADEAQPGLVSRVV
ncbi:MAG TPA: ABC transporter ATP-binding protein [Blastocatellia bacterium]|nr:ABC transporter ATP-binding protein [Blastocatellia bacterium]